MRSENVTNIFSALSQESRLAILRLLIKYGDEGLSAGAISDKLKITKNTLSFHLLLMTNAKLLNKRRKGTFLFYSANHETVKDVIDFLTKDCCAKAKNKKDCPLAHKK